MKTIMIIIDKSRLLKKIALTALLIIFSISFCQAQSIKKALEQQQQQQQQQQTNTELPSQYPRFIEIEDDIVVEEPYDDEEIVDEEIVDEEIFVIVESPPEFPGGDDARLNFLRNNVKYPQMAREAGIQGTVYVSFTVEKDGSITQVKIARGIGGGCDEEAVRIVRLMPKWKPGTQKGKKVRVSFNMPIKFTLQD